MQKGKTFKTADMAAEFAKWHKPHWIHPLWEGGTVWNPRHLVGYHVVYIVKE